MTKLKVKGIAVRSGLSKNNHMFLPDELEAASKRSAGKTFPLIKDHVATTDNTIGRVQFGEAMVDNQGITSISFKGFAIEDGSNILNRLKEGVITEVSIGGHAEKMLKESKDSDVLIPKGIHFGELSTTPAPAVEGTSIGNSINKNETEEKMNKIKQDDEPKKEDPVPEDKKDEPEVKKEEEESKEEVKTEASAIQKELEEKKKLLAEAKAKAELAQVDAELAKYEEKQEPKQKAITVAEQTNDNKSEGFLEFNDMGNSYLSMKREALDLNDIKVHRG